jgi:vacuolar-type H+-ATPase subunit F/Vma7
MLTTPKNKTDLIDQLKRENDFKVLAVHNGVATAVAKEVAKLGSKTVSVIVIETR